MTKAKGRLCRLDCDKLASTKWLPVPVAKTEAMVRSFLAEPFQTPVNSDFLAKNMTYSLHYLEYVDECLVQQRLTGLMTLLVWKTGIINSVAFVEAVLFCLIRRYGHAPIKVWDKQGKKTESFQDGDDTSRFKTVCQRMKKLATPKPAQLKFDEMITIAFEQGLLPSTFVRSEFLKLRDLRNRVHLTGKESDTTSKTSDYWAFKLADYENAKKVVVDLLIYFFPMTEEDQQNYGYFLRVEPPIVNDEF